MTTAAALPLEPLSIAGLRTRPVRLLFVAVALLAFSAAHLIPIVEAARTPSLADPAPRLRVHALTFPTLRAPKAPAAPAGAKKRPAATVAPPAPRPVATPPRAVAAPAPRPAVRAAAPAAAAPPIVSDSIDLAPAGTAAATEQEDPFAEAPVVTDTLGAPTPPPAAVADPEPVLPEAAPVAEAPVAETPAPAPAAEPAPAPAAPAPAAEPTRSLASAGSEPAPLEPAPADPPSADDPPPADDQPPPASGDSEGSDESGTIESADASTDSTAGSGTTGGTTGSSIDEGGDAGTQVDSEAPAGSGETLAPEATDVELAPPPIEEHEDEVVLEDFQGVGETDDSAEVIGSGDGSDTIGDGSVELDGGVDLSQGGDLGDPAQIGSGDAGDADGGPSDGTEDGAGTISTAGSPGSSDASSGEEGSIDPDGESSETDPDGVDSEAPDPNSGIGGGLSPPEPEPWIHLLDPASGHAVSIALGETTVDVTVDGLLTSRDRATVASLLVIGSDDFADAFAIDASAAAGGLAISLYGGAGGGDSLLGPATDTTWTVDGPGSGSFGDVSFEGFEDLEGAAGNEDVFVFQPGGSLEGSVEGGDGGFDTIVLEGPSQEVVSTITGMQSGVIVRDGATIAYDGFEPIDLPSGSGTVTINVNVGTGTTVEILDQGTSSDGQMVVTATIGESHVISVSGLTQLVINGGAGNDVFRLTSWDSGFTGAIQLDGGGGSDTFETPDFAGRFDVTGVDQGTWEASGAPKVSFAAVENLTGAATAADTFDFDTGAGVSGNVVDGAGTLTVYAAGFVKVSGDYDFVRETRTITYSDGAVQSTVAASILKLGGISGTIFVGVEPFDSPLGFEGTAQSFGLAVVTGGGKAWHAFQGTMTGPAFVGLGGEIELDLKPITITVNDEADDDTFLVLNGTGDAAPISVATGGTPVSLDFGTGIVAATTLITLTISDFVHVNGNLTFARGADVAVDVATGLTGTNLVTTALSSITNTDCSGSALGRSADFSTICNLEVSQFTVAATNVSVFVGYSAGLDAGADGILQRSELAADAVGLWAGGIDIGITFMSAKKTGLVPVDLLGMSFYALKATADAFELVGVPELWASADNIEVRVNAGKAWPTMPLAPAPVVNFAASFPTGYSIETGGPEDIEIAYATALLGASADRVLFRISDFVYVSGSFSLERGGIEHVDVRTGLTTAPATIFGGMAESATDPGGTSLARTADGSMIWNLPVDTIQIGFAGVDVFVGYTESLTAAAADGDLTQPEIEGAGGIGLFLDNVSVGLAMMSARPVTVPGLPALGLNAAMLRFSALRLDATAAAFVGIPELWISASDLQVRVNQGSATPGVFTLAKSLGAPPAVIDFTQSFGSSGYQVRTSTTGTTTVALTWQQPVVGASANQVLFRVSDFVYVSGGFSFDKGPVEKVDVRTGLQTAPATIFGTMTESATDPMDGSIARTANGSTIWNLPVETIQLGFDSVDVFVGYTESLDTAASDGDLTQAEIEAAGGIGLLLDDIDVGLVSMRALPVQLSGPGAIQPLGLNAAMLKFFGLRIDGGTVALVGIPELWLSANNLQVRVNQGSATPGVLTVAKGLNAPPAVVDFVQSFGSTGYSVKTDTAGNDVDLVWTQPVVGASADNVLFRVSDFVYVSGGFSFDKGPVTKVDVRTGLQTAPVGIFGTIAESATDPTDGSIGRTANGSTIWNLPVETIEIGLQGVDVFVGYTESLNAAAADGDLTQAEIEAAGGIGLFLDEVSLGMVQMRALPVQLSGLAAIQPLGLNAAMLKFFGLRIDASTVALLGIPELWLSANNLQVRVNQGSATPGVFTVAKGLNAPPAVVDFAQSFGSNGYEVRTDTSGSNVDVVWTQPVVGASADNVLFRVSDFVYVSGGFSFDKGPVTKVDVRTGLQTAPVGIFGTIAEAADDPTDGSIARTSDGSTIWNLPVETIEIGLQGVDVFVGYTESLNAAAADGDLTQAEIEAAGGIGLFLNEVSMGMVSMRALPVQLSALAAIQPLGLNAAMLKFFGLRVDASTVALLGIPELWLSTTNLQVRVNQGSVTPGLWTTTAGIGAAPPVVDFVQSFGSNGYEVRTDTSGSNVDLIWTQPLVGASADDVLFRISDFVYVQGGFSFNKGPVEKVDVKTGLTSALPTIFGSMTASATDPTDGSIARTNDGSMIWNLPVETIEIGLQGVDVFVGYTESLDAAAADGDLTTAEIDAVGGIGLFLDDVTLGMVQMRALPVTLSGLGLQPVGLNQAMLKFFALKATAGNIALVGVPELWLSGNQVQVRVNQGSYTPGAWPPAAPGAPKPVIDWESSYPDGHYSPDDTGSEADGYRVRTDTAGNYVALDYDSPVIGASADNVLLRVSDFVYVTGSFSFNQGPQHKVDVKTGLNAVQAGAIMPLIGTSDTKPTDGSLKRTTNGAVIWNLPVQALEIGIGGADVFVGYTKSLDSAAADGDLTVGELEAADAIGLYLDEVTLGFALFTTLPLDPITGAGLNAAKLRFLALQANAANLGITGVPEIVLEASGAQVRVNHGTFATWPAVAGVQPPPVIDFASSFPDNTYAPHDGDTAPDGYRVATNTSGAYVPLTYNGPLMGGGAEEVTIKISQFVYLTGSIYFEKGRTETVELTSLVGNLNDLLGQIPGFDSLSEDVKNAIGLTQKQVSFMTIGATNVHAFVGLKGPYWVDADGDDEIDRDPVTGDIVAAEVNDDAIGVLIDDLDFGLVMASPTNPLDPMRYVALRASANNLSLVGIEGLTASADDVLIEINLSSPAPGGLPILPVIDWLASFPAEATGTDPDFDGRVGEPAGFELPTGAAPIYIDFDSLLIRAKTSWIELDLFGVVSVQGSVAFALGPQETVTLSGGGGTRTVTTMTIGAANVSAFVGINGPYVLDKNGTTNPSAVGIHISDLDLGVFVGADILNPGAFVAVHLDIDSFGTVGIPGFTLSGALSIDLNLGASLLDGGAAIDFVTSFPDTDGSGTEDRAGYEVDTGDPANPVLLDYTGFLVDIQLAGTLDVASFLRVLGVFRLQADSSGLKVFAAGSVEIGPDLGGGTNLLDIQALGVLFVGSSGIAGDLDVDFSLGTSDLGFDVSARIIFNTTDVDQSIVIPQRLLNVVQASTSDLADDLLARLGTCGPDRCYTVKAGAPRLFSAPGNPDLAAVQILLAGGTPSAYEAAGDYVVVILSGSFNFLGFASGSGLGAVSVRTGAFEMIVDLDFTIGPLSFDVEGDLGIYSDGIALNLSVSLDVNLLSLFDLDMSGQLQINTTGSNNYFRLALSGSLEVLSVIELSGGITIVVNNGAWSFSIPSTNKLTATFGPLSLQAWGEVRSSGYFDINFTGSITLGDPSWTGITGSATLRAHFNPATGDFLFTIGGSFGAHFLGVELIGISASGTVSGRLGQYVTLRITVEGTGTFIEFVKDVVRMTKEAAEEIGATIVNFLGEIGCEIASWFGACEEWVEVEVEIPVNVDKLVSFTLDVVSFRLPSSLTNAAPPPPNLATKVGTVLHLNVGDETNGRAHLRNVEPGTTAESYAISHAGGTAAGETIRVVAFGRTETFTGITSIVGYFGSNSDNVTVALGVLVPVVLHGGSGNDSLSYQGSGAAQLYGDAGNDSLTLGGAANGTLATLILDGGAGNDTLVSDSFDPTTLRGQAGNDNLKGGSNNDVLEGGSGNDVLEGRGGDDTVDGGADNDLIREHLGNLVLGESFTGGGGTLDRIEILGGSGNEDVRLSASGSTLTIGEYSSSGVLIGSAATTTAEDITIALYGGSDKVLVNGSLWAASVQQVNVDVGSGGGVDLVDVKLSAGNDVVNLGTTTGPSTFTISWAGNQRIAIKGSAAADGDVLTIDALAGNDIVSGAAVLHVLWDRVDLIGGTGDDTIIGTPDDDTIDSGTGNDSVSGMGGQDVFVDTSGTDRLIEATASDFAIFGDLLLIGTATLGGSGDTRALIGFLAVTDENPSMFELIVLTGTSGAERNVFVAGSPSGSVTYTKGTTKTVAVTVRGGFIEFNGVGGNDEYLVELAGLDGATMEILETDEDIPLDMNGDGDTTDPGDRFVILAGGNDVVTIKGTSGADTGNAAFHGTVTRGATTIATTYVTVDIPGAAPTRILLSPRLEATHVRLLGGDDRFAVKTTNVVLSVDGGAGSDLILVGSAADEAAGTNAGGTLEGIDAGVTVAGGAGADTASFDDSGELAGNIGTLTSSTLNGLGLAPVGITYSGVETIGIDLGSGGDRLDILSTAGIAVTTLRTGAGSDTVNVSSDAPSNTGTLEGIAGALSLQAGAGTLDVLEVSDRGDTTAQSGTLTSTTLSGFGMGAVLSYAGFESLVLDLGSNADTLDVLSTHGGASTINARDGPDVVDLAGIAGSVTVNAGEGADDVAVRSTLAGSTLVVNGGNGADWVDVLALAGTVTIDGEGGDDTVEVGSAADTTPRAVDTGGDVDAVQGSLTVNGGPPSASDSLYVDETGDTSGEDGLLTSTTITGLGLGTGITYGTIEHLTIRLGADGTRFDVRSTLPATVLETGAGDDVVNVSSDAPANGGTLNLLAGHLTVDGQGGADTLNASDAGDTAPNTGDLTGTDLTGLGTVGITYAGLETLNVVLGSGGDTFTIHSTHASLTTLDAAAGDDDLNVRTVSGHTTLDAGTGADDVVVGSNAPAAAGLLDGIDALLELEGGDGTDTLGFDDTGDTTDNAGELTATQLSGLGIALHVGYLGFELLTVALGSGDDDFLILSTHAGQTTLNAGPGEDDLVVETIAGPTFVNGEAGDDDVTVNEDEDAPNEANGLGAVLTIDGGAGADYVLVNFFGNGDSLIDVADSGPAGDGDVLELNGTPVDDQFLLRHDLVALLTGPTSGAFLHAELVQYDAAIDLRLIVNGNLGDDRFALDDNSTETTVNGGEGNDRFQIGQLYGLTVVFDPRWPAVFVLTTRGQLTNGVSHATEINGGNGDDRFTVFRNVAVLDLNGDAGDDEFVIRTFLLEDEDTSVDGGGGADLIDYVANAPVNVDGGDGFDTLVVVGTEAADVFLITATAIYGAGRVVTFVAVERVDVDGMEGDDWFVVHSTAPGVHTRIFGGLGSDRIDIAGDIPPVDTGLSTPTLPTADHRTALIQGPVYVNGEIDLDADRSIGDPVLLPGESSSPLPVPDNPTLDVVEANQVDALTVHNDASTTDDTGTLTSSRIVGLNTAGDLTVAGRFVQGGITYEALEALTILLGPGNDTFTVESTHGGTTELFGAEGADAVTVLTIAGHTLVATGGGNDVVSVGQAGLLDGLAALLAIDGGAGHDLVVADDTADADDSLGTLTQTTLTGLDMAARAGVDRLYSLTIGAGATDFTISLAGYGAVTLAAGASAAALQAALQGLLFPDATSCGTEGESECSQSVWVWALGGDYLVGFQGEVHGLGAPAFSATGAGGTATDVLRIDGVNYYGLEELEIGLGSGHDRFDVRGTLPATSLDTGAGDDLVYVSDSADLAGYAAAAAAAGRDLAALHEAILHGTVVVDDLVFEGSLDLIAGALAIEAGTGSNTLSISDRADADADGAVTITDSSVVGLAPAPITYLAGGGDLAGQGHWTRLHDAGLFGRGVNLYGGSGGNAVSILSVLASDATPAPFAATITTLFAGDGADTVTIRAAHGSGKRLTIHGQQGQDTIDASAASLAIVAFGDEAADRLLGGSAGDVLFGDGGRVHYTVPAGVVGAWEIVLGGAPVESAAADGDFLTAELMHTASPEVEDDVIVGFLGNDVAFGGLGSDEIDAGEGDDVVVGDNGRYLLRAGIPLRLETTEPSLGGPDTLSSGSGNDLVLGGAGGDSIADAGGANVVLGDHGFLAWASDDADQGDLDRISSTDPNEGGADTIAIGGAGNDLVLGGTGGDTISTAGGSDLVFGDHGLVTGDIPLGLGIPAGPATFVWTSIFTQDADVLAGANDTIDLGDGRDVALGGQGADTISGGAGDDDLTGGHNAAGGQDRGDRIDGGAGNDVVAGDNASILHRGDSLSLRIRTLTAAEIYSVVGGQIVANVGGPAVNPTGVGERLIALYDHGTADGSLFGDDVLAGGAGDDVLFGQMGDDTIQGDGSTSLPDGTSAEAATDGDDYVEGGGGDDLILGGLGQDDLIGGSSSLYVAAGGSRPDGTDTIYGGAGTRTAHGDPGLEGADAHARDADTIVGDNGEVYRLRGASGFLAYAYDAYGTLRLIPRAVVLLDYSPTGDASYVANDPASPADAARLAGTGTNIGAGDFLHGEGGDDEIHGQTGADAIFGEGQDDRLYGESGADWISGGTGDDGILGDDGLLRLQRNGVAEPLNGLASTTQTAVTRNGDKAVVTVYQTGELRYVADLEPFFLGENDVLYGGLGNDALHGGAGDDAASGAEALPFYYVGDPLGLLASLAAYYAQGDVLGYDPATTLFRYYDAADPRRKIMVAPGIDFLLNFVAGPNSATASVVDDGKDVLFGGVGHDWLVGGTNEDHLWGGYGDDYLQADDNLDSTAETADPLANDTTDPRSVGPTYADVAYGGAGRDVLIANTYSDRLYDWSGEYNSYIVPFSPFGAQTISRWSNPSIEAYLYAISRADGADPTRGAVDNGEPYGEIGLVNQDDADWGDQHGGPRDPQPGNYNGSRDTTSLGFTSGGTSSLASATISAPAMTTISSETSTTTSTTTSTISSTDPLEPGSLTKKK